MEFGANLVFIIVSINFSMVRYKSEVKIREITPLFSQ